MSNTRTIWQVLVLLSSSQYAEIRCTVKRPKATNRAPGEANLHNCFDQSCNAGAYMKHKNLNISARKAEPQWTRPPSHCAETSIPPLTTTANW
eukprot:678393-Rhodomonas_salina.1